MSFLRRNPSTSLASAPIFNHLSQLNQEIGRFFERDWPATTPALLEGAPLWQTEWAPPVDIRQEAGQFVITADVPGIEAKDIKVSMADNAITIEGKREVERKEEGRNYSLQERSYGSFCRSFTLPLRADASKIKAKSTNGVLTITVPIAEEEKAKRIDVRIES